MTATDRLSAERQFHDRQAAERAAAFCRGEANLVFADADYLDHETWVRSAFARLGPLAGKTVLDFGCGHGMAAVVLARAGAVVTACDLSAEYVREARRRAAANAVAVACIQADGERLPFASESFDAIWGSAILHHLDLTRAGPELARVLRPSGVAVFCEPWGENPLLTLARRSLPYPGKHRTADEQPLRRRNLAPLRAAFRSITVEGVQLFGMVRRALARPGRPVPRFVTALDRLDDWALARWPGLGNWCRYVVLTLRAR